MSREPAFFGVHRCDIVVVGVRGGDRRRLAHCLQAHRDGGHTVRFFIAQAARWSNIKTRLPPGQVLRVARPADLVVRYG